MDTETHPIASQVNDTGKWLLSFGIHRGTLMSRDSGRSEHGSEEEARASYRDQKAAAARFGYSVWFAQLIAPGAPWSSGWVTLDRGESYF
jgi:hypothetical protein